MFFTKVNEELNFIPAHIEMIEYRQEKAVFKPIGAEHADQKEQVIGAERPAHPIGKCQVTTSLLTYLIVSKYADGLSLYRLEQMLKRLGQEVSRTNMASGSSGWRTFLNR